MIKNLLNSIIILAFLLSFSKLEAKVTCTGADITFTSFTITAVSRSSNVNSYYYNYTLKNIGTDPVQVNKIVLQNYVSQDNAFDNNDQPGGGSYVDINSTATIAAGDTYSGTYEANSTGTVSAHPYLIVQSQYTLGECNATNNQIIVCLNTDATVPTVTFTNVTSSTIDFGYDVKNVGGDTLFLNKVTLEFYGSMDNTLDGSDKLLGVVINVGSSYVLANNTDADTYVVARSNNYFYTYLIANISYNGTECSTPNNTTAFVIPTVSGVINQTNDLPGIIVNTESNSFLIKEWTKASNGSNLNYKIYNYNGSSIASGNTSIGQSNSIQGLSNGIYLLEISAGELVTYQRFAY